jgi:hypothetical protein
MSEKSYKMVVHYCVLVSLDEKNVDNVLYAFLVDRYQFQTFITQREYLGCIPGWLPESPQVKYFFRTFETALNRVATCRAHSWILQVELKRIVTWRNEIRFMNLDIVHTVHHVQQYYLLKQTFMVYVVYINHILILNPKRSDIHWCHISDKLRM